MGHLFDPDELQQITKRQRGKPLGQAFDASSAGLAEALPGPIRIARTPAHYTPLTTRERVNRKV